MEPSQENIEKWVSDVVESPKTVANEQEIREACNLAIAKFIEADQDNSGLISTEELGSLCEQMGLPLGQDEREEALLKMDNDKSGELNIHEWVSWWLARVSRQPDPAKQQEAVARTTFRKFDIDGTGSLDATELRTLLSALGADFSVSESLEALRELDTDNSGLIDEQEFVDWWTNRASANRRGGGLMAQRLKKLAAKASVIFSTDIFTAAWNGDMELMAAFLKADRRMRDASDLSQYGNGWCPLHYAAYQGHVQIVAELLSSGAKVNATNNDGFNALFYAAQQENIEVCRALLDAGADPSLTGEVIDAPEVSCTPIAGVYLCAADHCQGTPALLELFRGHAKCIAPTAIGHDKITASIAPTAALLLTIQLSIPQRVYSQLPIKTWQCILTYEATTATAPTDDCSTTILVSGKHPDRNTSIEVSIDKTWFRRAMVQRAQRIFLSLVAVNCLGEAGLATEGIDVSFPALPPLTNAAPDPSEVQAGDDTLMKLK